VRFPVTDPQPESETEESGPVIPRPLGDELAERFANAKTDLFNKGKALVSNYDQLEPYGSAAGAVGICVYVPLALALLLGLENWLGYLVSWAAWASWPLALYVLPRIARGDSITDDDIGLGVGLGLLVLIVDGIMAIADGLVGGYFLRPILGFIVGKTLATTITGALAGGLLGYALGSMFCSKQFGRESFGEEMVRWGVPACGVAGLLTGGLYSLTPMGHVIMLSAMAIAVSGSLTTWLLAEHPGLSSELSRRIARVGVPCTLLLGLLSLTMADGETAAPVEDTPVHGSGTASARAVIDFSGTWEALQVAPRERGYYDWIRLTQTGSQVVGEYHRGGRGQYKGTVDGLRLDLKWSIAGSRGTGEILRQPDGNHLYRWRLKNETDWHETWNLRRTKPGRNSCLIEVKTTPDKANVYLHGVCLGQSPQSIYLQPGEAQLKVAQKGYWSEERLMTVSPGEESVHITLVAE